MRIVRRGEFRRMRWKNGKGVTEEIASFPEGAGLDGLEWRLSIAHVDADGPFSVFPGIDRTIALLDGAGLTLDTPEGEIALAAGGEPFAFPGEWEISSRNAAGATVDLNVMTRRGRWQHEMRRVAAGADLPVAAGGWVVFNAPATLLHAGQEIPLERYDAVRCEGEGRLTLAGDRPVEALVVELRRRDDPAPR